jgi:hypothetical protein
MGVDVLAGAAGDMAKLGIYESYKVKRQVRGRHCISVVGAVQHGAMTCLPLAKAD